LKRKFVRMARDARAASLTADDCTDCREVGNAARMFKT
jgi:hypothetical protein